jgi:predicted glycoside hydrolase/deacetylase ChbG (UPF0249 family)
MTDQVKRCLIVNADDFGQSRGVNRGIVKAHQCGIVTSASLMVRYPASTAAAAEARDHPSLGLGLHLDLAGWEQSGGEWQTAYVVADTASRTAVAAELERQLDRFRMLVGTEPTHLDSHHHVHRAEPVHSLAVGAAEALSIPLREHGPVGYCGAFYGQDRHGATVAEAISPESLIALIENLPPGVTELACHPATRAEAFTSYSAERVTELRSLCHPDVRRAVREGDVELCNFGQIDQPLRDQS